MQAFSGLVSHYLFEDRFGRPGKGNDKGQTVTVRRWDANTGTLSLFLPAQHAVEVSDTFAIRPGCDKSFATSKAKFDNAINFRGFPHVPDDDQILRYPDAQS